MKNRYPGLKPFTEKEQNLFFGRNEDIENLYQKIRHSQIVVVHSKSGLGKSSLLNAGIVPKVIDNKLATPYTIRLGGYSENTTEQQFTPVEKLKNALKTDTSKGNFAIDKIAQNDTSLWYHFKKLVFSQKQLNNNNLLLIFDQFEELFTYPVEQVQEFGEQIITALRESFPAHLIENIEKALNDSQINADELEQITQPLNIKVVFAIRSDRMSLMQQLVKYLPDILHNLYELSPMGLKQAREAIVKPAQLPDAGFLTKPFEYQNDLVEKILNSLKDRKDHIETFQLQIVCSYCENQITKKQSLTSNPYTLTPKDVSDIKDILENFYTELLENLKYKNEDEKLNVRKVLEETLIFEKDQRRMLVYEGVLKTMISAELLKQLADSFIIRSEPYSSGGFSYELSHDTLVAPILKAGKIRKAKAQEAEQLRMKNEELRIEKKKQAKLRKILISSGAIILFIACLSIWAIYQMNKAQKLARQNKIETLIAESQKLLFMDDTKSFETAKEAFLMDSTYQHAINNLIYNYNTCGTFYEILSKRQSGINSVQISPDEKYFLLANNDSALLCDRQGKLLKTIGKTGLLNYASFSPDGTKIAIAGADKVLTIYDLQNNLLLQLNHTMQIYSVVFSPDGQKILTACEDTSFNIWNLKGKLEKCFGGHNDAVYFATFTKDGQRILTASADNTARLWDTEKRQLAVFKGHTRAVTSANFSPDESMVVTSSKDSTAKVWSIDGRLLFSLNGHNEIVTSACFSHNGKWILTTGNDRTAKIWDLKGNLLNTLKGHTRPVNHAIFSKDDKMVYTVSGDFSALDNTLRQWNIADKKVVSIPEESFLAYSVLSNNAEFVFTATGGIVKKYNKLGGLLKEMKLFENRIIQIEISPNDKNLFVLTSDSLKIIDFEGKVLESVRANTAIEFSFATFHPTAQEIFVACSNGLVFKYKDKILSKFSANHSKQINYIAISNDGETIATASDDSTIAISNREGKLINKLKTLSYNTSANFSPNGKQIVSTGGDKYLRLWNLQGKRIDSLHLYDNETSFACFTPDGKRLLSASKAAREAKLTTLKGEEIYSFPCVGRFAKSVKLSKDGKYVLISNSGFWKGENVARLFLIDANEIMNKK